MRLPWVGGPKGFENRRLLLLAPSHGFGGGIERSAEAIAANWPGPVVRVDLYRPDETAVPEGNPRAKLRFVARALAAGARQRPAVVIALHVNLLPVALLLGSLVKARVAMFGHGVEVWGGFPWWMRWLIRRCKRVLAVSAFTAQWMARGAGISANRIRVLHWPVDRRFTEASLAECPPNGSADSESTCLVSVTRLVAQDRFKGCFEVAEALPRILAERPNVRWTVVGSGADLPVLRARCEGLGVDHAVTFTGAISDEGLVEAYRRADIFVLPSRADPEAVPPIGEGFGLVFAEAGAFGVPSVGSSAGGGSLEFVVDGRTGLTVPPNHPEALVRAIVRLVDDRDLRDRLGQAAKALVQSRHAPSQFGGALYSACR